MSDNEERCTNYLRIISTVIDLGTETALELLYYHKPRQKMKDFLAEYAVQSKLEELKRRKILKLREYNLVNSLNPNPDEFDLNLLITLLSNLFRGKLQEPKKGWETWPPASDDLSIGADLLRLRRIRNDIVAHRSKAQLPPLVFMDLWTELEGILLRMISVISPKKEQELKYRLTVYKTKTLDSLAVQSALDKVHQWYDEVNKVQKRVDDLAKHTQALCEFYQEIPQQYRRYSTLLVDCGRLVMLGIWDRESQKYGSEIESLLLQNRENLTADPVCAKSEHLIFPEEKDELFNPSELDISVLASVLLCLFSSDLDADEDDAINQLRKARHDYADTAFSSNEAFMERWTDLIMNLRTLSAGLPKEKQREVNAFIKTYSKNTAMINSDRCMEELSDHGNSLKSFADIYGETMVNFKEALNQMEEEGIPFGEEKVVVLKMYIRGSSHENSELAESIVESLIKKAHQMTNGSNGYDEIRKAVDRILEHIQNIDDATLLSSSRGCILLSFQCCSYSGLVGLLDYFEGSLFACDRDRLQEDLFYHFTTRFQVRVHLTQESKQHVLESLDGEKKRKEEGYIPVRIACTTLPALREVHKRFTSVVETSNMINDTSDAISKELNDKCSVEIKLDLRSSHPLLSGDCSLHGLESKKEDLNEKLSVTRSDYSPLEQERNKGAFAESPTSTGSDCSPPELETNKITLNENISPSGSNYLQKSAPTDTNLEPICPEPVKEEVVITNDSKKSMLAERDKLSLITTTDSVLYPGNTVSTIIDKLCCDDIDFYESNETSLYTDYRRSSWLEDSVKDIMRQGAKMEEELKLRILKRKLCGEEGLQKASFEEPVKRENLSEEELMRKLRRKEQNRRAAEKFRARKTLIRDRIFEKYKTEKERGDKLKDEVEKLTDEKKCLEELIHCHRAVCSNFDPALQTSQEMTKDNNSVAEYHQYASFEPVASVTTQLPEQIYSLAPYVTDSTAKTCTCTTSTTRSHMQEKMTDLDNAF